METKLYLYLCLPPRFGGIGIHAASLNPRIRLSYTSAITYGIEEIRPDLYWDIYGHKLALEYDSDTYHSTSAAINKDAKRRNILLSEGIANITLTRSQVSQFKQLNAAATTIANLLGMRLSRKPGTKDNYILYCKLFKSDL